MKKTLLKSLFAAVLVLTMLITCSAVVSAAGFRDVTEYKEAINALNELEIIKGISATTFEPNSNISRVQMAILVSRMRTGDVRETTWSGAAPGNIPFTDVSDDPKDYHYPAAIYYAYQNNIIGGRGNGIFDPTATITVQEAAAMIVRTLYYPSSAYAGNDWSAKYMAKADELGIFEGVDELKYSPLTVLTRGEVAQMLYNALYAPCYGSTSTKTKTLAEDVWDIKSGVKMVLVATHNQKLIGGVTKPSVGYVLMAELKANGTYGDTHTFKASDLKITSPDEELGTMYTIKSTTQAGYNYELVSSYTKGESKTYTTGLSVSTTGGGSITLGNLNYSLVSSYSYSLEDGKTPGSRQIIVYGTNDLFSSLSSNVLTASAMANKTGAYTLKTFDDNGDNYPDRAIFTPYSLGKYTESNGRITITAGKTTKLDKVQGAITVSTTANTKVTSGQYVLYSYNPQTLVLEIAQTFTPQKGIVSSYSNGTVRIGNMTYTLGLDQLPGASRTEILAVAQSVLVQNYTISYIVNGQYIIAIDVDASQAATYESSSLTGVITAVDKTALSSGYITLTVYTYGSAETKAVMVSTINNYPVAYYANSLAVGDIVELTRTAGANTAEDLTDDRYNAKSITATPSYRVSNMTVLQASGGALYLYEMSGSGNTKYWMLDANALVVQYSGSGAPAVVSASTLANMSLMPGYAIYVSTGDGVTTVPTIPGLPNYYQGTVKMVYIRPAPYGTGSGTVNPLTFDKVVYLSQTAIAGAQTSMTTNGQLAITYTFANAIDMVTGQKVSATYTMAYTTGTSLTSLTPGYYKASGTQIIEATPVTEAAGTTVSMKSYASAPSLTPYGTTTYITVGGQPVYATSVKIYISNPQIGLMIDQTTGLPQDMYAGNTNPQYLNMALASATNTTVIQSGTNVVLVVTVGA